VSQGKNISSGIDISIESKAAIVTNVQANAQILQNDTSTPGTRLAGVSWIDRDDFAPGLSHLFYPLAVATEAYFLERAGFESRPVKACFGDEVSLETVLQLLPPCALFSSTAERAKAGTLLRVSLFASGIVGACGYWERSSSTVRRTLEQANRLLVCLWTKQLQTSRIDCSEQQTNEY
jgi:hypothetical protein